MTLRHNIWIVVLAVFVLNIPFGYWRASVRKLSPRWFLAVHLPVPIAVGLRLWSGLPWRWATFPLFIGAFFGGQYVGWLVRDLKERRVLNAQPLKPHRQT